MRLIKEKILVVLTARQGFKKQTILLKTIVNHIFIIV